MTDSDLLIKRPDTYVVLEKFYIKGRGVVIVLNPDPPVEIAVGWEICSVERDLTWRIIGVERMGYKPCGLLIRSVFDVQPYKDEKIFIV